VKPRDLGCGPDEMRALRLRLDSHPICIICNCTLDTYPQQCAAEGLEPCPGFQFVQDLRQQVRDQNPPNVDRAP
jgi:hypothetical protein